MFIHFEKITGGPTLGGNEQSARLMRDTQRTNSIQSSPFDLALPRGEFSQTVSDVFAMFRAALLGASLGLVVWLFILLCLRF